MSSTVLSSTCVDTIYLLSHNLFDLEVEVSKEGLFDGQQKEGLGTPKRYDGESTMMKVKALFESPGLTDVYLPVIFVICPYFQNESSPFLRIR